MAFKCFRHPDAFSLDRPGMKTKRKRQEVGKHLAWIRTLPCLVSGARNRIEAAHVRYSDPRFAKRALSGNEKPDDRWTVPLSAQVHREAPDAQHNHNERAWWEQRGIDPVAVAAALWGCTGDDEAGEQIIREAQRSASARAAPSLTPTLDHIRRITQEATDGR